MSEQFPVEGFNLVHAKGLSDTNTKPPEASGNVPEFTTQTPIVPKQQLSVPPLNRETPLPPPTPSTQTALDDNSKSVQFNARFDFMIADFFSRQVNRLLGGEALDRNYRIFQQKFKEGLGAQWAHITSQPEVDEAIAQVQALHDYFERLERLITKQLKSMEFVNDVETEVSLYYQQEGLVEPEGKVRTNLIAMSSTLQGVCQDRAPLIQAYEAYLDFLKTFRKKAINDSLETMKRQRLARLELDSYGSRLGQLEEKKLKSFTKAPASLTHSDAGLALERDLETARLRFQAAKTSYQTLSTQLIDKASLLTMKKTVDFAAHLERIRIIYDQFNRALGARAPKLANDTDTSDKHMDSSDKHMDAPEKELEE